VKLRTRLFPPLEVALPAGGGGQGSPWGDIAAVILQPEVEAGPLIYAPHGRPGDQWIAAAGLALVVVGLLTWRLLRRS
jgi:hypothetical protein